MENEAVTFPILVYPSMALLSPSPELWSSGDIIYTLTLADYLVYCHSSSKLGSNLGEQHSKTWFFPTVPCSPQILSWSSGIVLFGKLCYVPLYFMLQAAGELATLQN